MNRGAGMRLLMLAAAVGLFVFYAVAAYLSYLGLLFVWNQRPDPVTTAVLVVAVALAFGYASYEFGTARILRALDAREIAESEAPELYRRLDALADSFDVESPTLLVARMEAPNVLALGGPSDGRVVVDARLFRLLTAPELETILAHELTHLENRDGLVQTLGYSLVRTVSGFLLLLLLPVTLLVAGTARAVGYARGDSYRRIQAATTRARLAVTSLAVLLLFAFTLALRAYSRRREYAADDRAVAVTGRPRALAEALRKIERASTPTGPLASLYIHGDEEGTLTRLLATHPPMDERLARLDAKADDRAVTVPVR
ncbi:M48 family metallopeptidase [Halorarius halobius]|uniref:M48 family metallopeptidase n=1 Tax=Halorarius halobius TaxID=2962671 RepID=UPI0020CC462B|nr:M48 family metalloprotease [Halorarius halobius]